MKDVMAILQADAYKRAFTRAEPLDMRSSRQFPGGVFVALSVNK